MSDVTTETQVPKQFDPEAFALNLARAMENSGQALAAYLKPRENGEAKDKPPNELTEVVKTFTAVAEYWLSDNDRSTELQAKIAKAYIAQLGEAHAFDAAIVTTIEPDRPFYPAEAYHQDFLARHPGNAYIAAYDLPKLDELRRLLPDLYRADPVLVAAGSLSN